MISWLQSPSAVILDPQKINSITVSTVTHLFAMKCGTRCHDLTFLNVEFKAKFFTLLFHFHQEALVYDTVQEAVIKTIPKKKKCKKAKWLSEEALQIAVKRREVKGKGEKERYTHLNAEFQRIARRDKKAFLSDQCKYRTVFWTLWEMERVG